MAQDFAAFSRKLDRVTRDLTDRKTLTRLGVAAKGDAAEAVRGDLGDLSMSNWWRGRPVPIAARFDLVGDSGVKVLPTPRARGPMRVLEDGRRAGQSRGRRGRAPRPVSASRGKGTWSDAERLMAKRTPGRVHDEVKRVLRRHLTGV